MKIETLKLKDLTPYEKNAKEHPQKQVEQIKESIQRFGMNDPIAVWGKKNIIVEGHGRFLACKELGIEEVPCIRLDHMTDVERREYTLIHNKTTMNSDFNFGLLEDELKAIEEEDLNIDMSSFDFVLPEEDEEKEEPEAEEDKFDETEEVEPIAQRGDIFLLGEHRLMCGDSTSREDVYALMDGKIANLVFTDPPYGMKKESDGVLNDNLNFDDLLEFNKKWIPISFEFLDDVGSWYCWGIDEPLMDIYSNILKPKIKNSEITFRNLLTWDKGNGQGQMDSERRMYATADEKCLFVMKGVQGFNTNSDNYYEGWEPIRSYLANEWRKISDRNNWDELLGNCMGKHYFTKSQWLLPTAEAYKKLQELGRGHDAFKKEYEEIKKEYYATRAYFNNTHDNMNNVWHFNRTEEKEREEAGGHATPKPIALCSRAIKSSSRERESSRLVRWLWFDSHRL